MAAAVAAVLALVTPWLARELCAAGPLHPVPLGADPAGRAGRGADPDPRRRARRARRGAAPDRAGPARRHPGAAGRDRHAAGLARKRCPTTPQPRPGCSRDAHEGTEEAMTELRDVIREHLPADPGRPRPGRRGTSAGGRSARARSTSTSATCRPAPGRGGGRRLLRGRRGARPTWPSTAAPPSAGSASRRRGDRLSVTVSDDGGGGADERRGTGLAGHPPPGRRARRHRHRHQPARRADRSCTVELPCGS